MLREEGIRNFGWENSFYFKLNVSIRSMKNNLLVVGLVFVMFLSGCPNPGPATEEEKAEQIADGTPEGKIVMQISETFDNFENCTADEFVSMMQAQAAVSGAQLPELTTEAKAELAKGLEDAKKCSPSIVKDTKLIEGSTYEVSYNMNIPEECDSARVGLVGASGKSFVVVEVNTTDGSHAVIEGKLSEEELEQANQLMPLIGLSGNCGAMMMLGGTAPADTGLE